MKTAFFAQHEDLRLAEVLHLLNPPAGYALWHGGPSIHECLEGVDATQAIWKPNPNRFSIWHFVLHISYWKYRVRQGVTGSENEAFSRQPDNFPEPNNTDNEASWQKDVSLMIQEDTLLIQAVKAMNPRDLDRAFPSGNRLMDQLTGIAMHDAYHVAQIQLVKKLYEER